MLLWWEVRRADFGAMLAHHVCTIVLIVGAHICHFHRAGALVMLLHDPSDVLLEGAKLASYAGWQGAAGALFGALTVSWAALRLGCLPRVVVSVWRDAALVWSQRAARWLAAAAWALRDQLWPPKDSTD